MAGKPGIGGLKDKVSILLFVMSLSLPLLVTTFRLDPVYQFPENRVPAPRPELAPSWAVLAEFPSRFEAYFNENIGLRRTLTKSLNLLKVTTLGLSPSPKVILGSNDWLYYGDIDVDYYRTTHPLSSDQLNKWQHLLESRRDWLAKRGIPYLVVVAANKSTIYPEYLPRSLNRVCPQSRLDQLLAYMKDHSSVKIVSLREPLEAAKAHERVYYRTDTHWNERGAYVGYAAIIDGLSAWFPKMRATPRSSFGEVEHNEPGRDLAWLIDLREHYADRFYDLDTSIPRMAREVREPAKADDPPPKPWRRGDNFIYEHPDQSLPRAVIFRDSFATWLMPHLAEHFRRVVFCWQYIFDQELVDREHPDVVIQQFVERHLMDDPLPYQ